jgi:hypothetical protein
MHPLGLSGPHAGASLYFLTVGNERKFMLVFKMEGIKKER